MTNLYADYPVPSIAELLDELCPDGLPVVSLNDVCTSIFAGGDKPVDIQKVDQAFGEYVYPVYSNGVGEASLYGYSSDCRVDERAVTISARGTIGYHTIREAGFTPIIRLITLVPDASFISAEYLDYALTGIGIDGDKGGIPQLTTPNVKRLEIPLPPVEVQREIVVILDTFTDLQANLNRELELRREQTSHYRDAVLDFDSVLGGNYPVPRIFELLGQLCPDGVPLVPLGEVSEILNGFAFKSALYSDAGVRVIRISDVQKGSISDKDIKYYPAELSPKIERYLLNDGDIVMSLTGNAGRVATIHKEHLPAGLNQRVARIRPTDQVLDRWLFHILGNDAFELEAMLSASGAGQKNLSTRWLARFLIPLPPLDIQREIVAILDTFTDLENALTRDISLREQQLEYYRDQLLTFPTV